MSEDSLNDRVRELRDIKNLGRKAFSELLGCSRDKIANIENNKQKVPGDIIEAMVNEWPEHAYWLVSGKEIPEAGQVSPSTEKKRLDSKGTEKAG